MNRPVALALVSYSVLLVALSPLHAATFTIDFDVNAVGQAISAPSIFDNASPLRNLYSPLGVHFNGPTVDSGGYILNDSTFTTPARSGSNFLAFSAYTGPETVTFDSPMSFVSVYACGLGHTYSFTLQAFDVAGNLLDTNTLSTSGYSQLSVSSAGAIRKVTLAAPTAGVNSYVFDDLFVTSVPEPSKMAIWAVGGVLSVVRRRHSSLTSR
jgi:hypothetical protein